MFIELDFYFVYLKLEVYQDLQISIIGEFGGFGIEVGMEDGFVKVIIFIDDIFVKKVGVEFGDLIIKLDFMSVKGLFLSEVVKLMCGKFGFKLFFIIICEGVDKLLEIIVICDVI